MSDKKTAKKPSEKPARHNLEHFNSYPWRQVCRRCGTVACDDTSKPKDKYGNHPIGYFAKDGTAFGKTALPCGGFDPASLLPWQREAIVAGWTPPKGWKQ